MNKPISCSAQEMLEAAIIQKRRLDIKCQSESGEVTAFQKVLPADVFTKNGCEYLAFFTHDNEGGIIKLTIISNDIISFEAKDFKDPRIFYQRSNDFSCGVNFTDD